MNSFVTIAEKNTMKLAVVAPGIADALLVSAIGLVAAIPAVKSSGAGRTAVGSKRPKSGME